MSSTAKKDNLKNEKKQAKKGDDLNIKKDLEYKFDPEDKSDLKENRISQNKVHL